MKWLLLIAAVIFLAGGAYVLSRKGWDGWWIASAFGVAAVAIVWVAAMTS